MINTPEISILIPVYKVEHYLPSCINSVLSQDFSNYELILVDDGSPDRCPEICDGFARQDGRIRVIHKKNGGLVSARLAGFQASKGKYLMFLDSDDWLYPHALTLLYEKICEGYDIVKGNDLRIVGTASQGIIECPKCSDSDIVGNLNYLRSFLKGDLLPYIWGGLFRRELFTEEIFRSIVDCSTYEDALTNIAIWRGVNRYATINETVQAYFINPDSMMQQVVVSHQYLQKVSEIIYKSIADTKDEDILMIAQARQMAAHLRVFFMPELSWSQLYYEKIRFFLRKENHRSILIRMIDHKFLYFISIPYAFRFYTMVYRKLYKSFKLKHINRRIIY